MIPFECIVRGYISGSAWSEYKRTSTVGGMMIAEDMRESQKFTKALFTPSTKASEGHDINISYREMLAHMDEWIARYLKDKSLELYNYAHDLLKKEGILVADTKFEFGSIGNEIILIDECSPRILHASGISRAIRSAAAPKASTNSTSAITLSKSAGYNRPIPPFAR